MKKILLIIFMISTASSAFGEEHPKKSGLEVIIEAMAVQYAQSAAQNWALTKMEEEATKRLGKDLAQQLGESAANVLSMVGIIENVNSYDDAKTEGQKYSAAAHATASAIAMATAPIPVIGLVVQLGVIGQDLMAAFISKDFLLEQARLRADIIRTYKKISDLQAREFDAELTSYKDLSNRLGAISVLNKTISAQHEILCEKGTLDYKTPEACLASLLTIEQLLFKQVQSIQAIVNFNGRFINATSLKIDIDFLKSQLTNATASLANISNSIRYALNQVAFAQVLAIKTSIQRERIFRECRTSILIQLKEVLQSKKEVLEDSDYPLWRQSALDEKKLTLQNLSYGICLEYFNAAPDEIKTLTERALQ